jgi:hypothetical protein
VLLSVAALAVAEATAGAGDDVTVPARVQAQLLVAVASFQSNMNLAADGSVQILVLTKNDDAGSERVAGQLVGALGDIKKIAHHPHHELVQSFHDATTLAATCRERHISIVYLSPGLGTAIPDVAQVLRGTSVLTAGAVASFVQRGVVLGFDLVSGRSEMLLNRTQMKALNVQFPPMLFQLMKIVE